MLRLFFALQPPASEGAALVELVRPLATEIGAQPVNAQNLHATLCFVGAVAPERLAQLRDAAATVHGPPVTLRFAALEFWEQPKVLCATAAEDEGARRAHELSRDLLAAAIAAGFAPDVKPFRAHLTLARKARAELAASAQWPRVLPEFAMHCDRFALMESRRGEFGSIYSVVDSWPLDGAKLS
jgi:RNA 2',3'-cyclic 3'-phosphodiesterase